MKIKTYDEERKGFKISIETRVIFNATMRKLG